MKKHLKILSVWIVILLLCLCSCTSQETQTPQEERPYITLSVLSYNLRCSSDGDELNLSRRLPRICDRLTTLMPDLFGCQECTFTHLLWLQQATEDQYDYVFQYRDNSLSSECCPIFYKKDRFDLLDSGHFWFSETPDVMSKPEYSNCYRVCTWVKLSDKETGVVFYYYNTHLDTNRVAYEKSIPLLLERLPENEKVFITGDFNFTPSADAYTLLTQGVTDTSVFLQKDTDISTYHAYRAKENYGIRIDYVFFKGDDICPTDYTTVCNDEEIWGEGNYSSDHFPVLGEYKIYY